MFKVLQSKREIRVAREAMRSQGRSILRDSLGEGILRRLKLSRELKVGDYVKSWDVDLTLKFIDEHVSKDADILDFGAYCSEVPVALAQMEYTGVSGLDLNSDVCSMPRGDIVSYRVGDFLEAPYQEGSFEVITAVSVIEHGYQPARLFAEVARLLRPGGYFIASFDYWPEKIDTGETKFFDLSWMIFSSQDVLHLLDMAAQHGLKPVGETHAEAGDRAIRCAGYDYTFGWIALQKLV